MENTAAHGRVRPFSWRPMQVERTKGGFLPAGEALRPLEQVICDLNRRLYDMAIHTHLAGSSYRVVD